MFHDSPVGMRGIQTWVHQSPVEDRDDEIVDDDELEEHRADLPEFEGRGSVRTECVALSIVLVVRVSNHDHVTAVEPPAPIRLVLRLTIEIESIDVQRDELIDDEPDAVQVPIVAQHRVVRLVELLEEARGLLLTGSD